MPDSGRSPSGSFSGALSPILTISISGREAIAAAWGCLAHSSMVRTMPAPFAAMIAFLELERVPLRHRLAHRLAILGTPSTLSAAARWFGKLQCR